MKDIVKFVNPNANSSKSNLIQELTHLSHHGIVKDFHENTLDKEPNQPNPDDSIDEAIEKLLKNPQNNPSVSPKAPLSEGEKTFNDLTKTYYFGIAVWENDKLYGHTRVKKPIALKFK